MFNNFNNKPKRHGQHCERLISEEERLELIWLVDERIRKTNEAKDNLHKDCQLQRINK